MSRRQFCSGLLPKLRAIVLQIANPQREVFRLATGHAQQSPFTSAQVREARHLVAEAIQLEITEADRVPEYQPFYLVLLSHFMERIRDPGWRQALVATHSYANGVPIGVNYRMP